MFIGHIAVGLAGKRVAPRTSLGWLLTAATLLDLLWPILLLLGIEKVSIAPGNTAMTPLDFESYPWSHSLLMALLWSVLFAALYRVFTGYARGAAVLGSAVLSHWVLDWITHRPDLPLTPWRTARAGLGLWNSVPATVAIEGAMFVAALWLYLATTRARGLAGHLSLWLFVALIVAAYAGNVLGPPPPSAEAIGRLGLATWLFVPWAFWIDRSRVLRAPA